MASNNEKLQDTAEEAKKSSSIYDMLRNKAKDMGHSAANLPNGLWDKYSQMFYKRSLLKDSKLTITDYMMGRLSSADLAEIMANDDALRYTMSDICRMRLEPADIDIEHNGKYIDIAAGAKTFWSEMHVPIPSEIDAARDLRNVYFGIEAGRAAVMGKQNENAVESEPEQDEPKKQTIREKLHDIRQKAAQKGIDMLTPLAMETENDQNVDDANQSVAELDSEQVEQAYQNMIIDRKAKEIENISMAIEASKDIDLEESERIEALKATGLSETKAESVVQNTTSQNTDPKIQYTPEELNAPMDDQIAEILDQIQKHASRDLKGYKGRETAQNQSAEQTAEPEKEKRLRKGYVSGEFEGKSVRFKGSWSTHTFSDEEVDKLLAGESITFTYTNKSGEDKEVSGKLEYQKHEGRDFLGFKANFGKKKQSVEVPDKGDNALFNAQDEALAMGYEKEEPIDISPEELDGLFETPDPEADMAAYQEMKASEDSTDEEVSLTDADVSAIGDEGMPFSK